MTTYILHKSTKPADFRPGSHAQAAVKALAKMKKATAGEISDFVKKNRLLKTDMDLRTAIAWILTDLTRRKLIGKVSKPKATKKAA